MSAPRLAFALLASLLVACSSDSGDATDATTGATGGAAGTSGQGGSAAHAGSGQSGGSTPGSGGHAGSAGHAAGGTSGASGSTPGSSGGTAQAGSGQSGKSQGGAGQAGSGQSGNGQSGQTQSGGQAGAGQAGSGQAGEGQAGSGQAGAGQAGDGQAGSGQAGDGQAGSGNAGSGQAGDGAGGQGQAGDGPGGAAGSGGESGGSGGASAGGLAEVLTESLFNEMFPHREEPSCSGGIFTYAALLEASKAFPLFASEGTLDDRKRELAAFLANAGHETTGGWAAAPDGPQAWGLCFREELGCESGVCTSYCVPDAMYPCAPGKTYQGRGPLQLSYNYNYGQAGDALSLPLLATPELVATDGLVSFKTALWFWMTAQAPKPSCHDVMVGQWQPSAADVSAGRVPGFGLTVDIINGGVECDQPTPAQVSDRIAFYQRFTTELSVAPGDALACDQMQHY